ncbi:MAG: hypothetical protein BWX88_03100 [Planctomycetes bacterium ADurb.Bin126]|nr:MAG: hypothetical protein BWX88_03100 [Planctomycetes bacterium ADurb.Bin126]HOD83062.1 hypothetical protein [Phycisphaerae bacterium]HQL72944.1 hypothetical protein [Phycisphaerae bacterium]
MSPRGAAGRWIAAAALAAAWAIPLAQPEILSAGQSRVAAQVPIRSFYINRVGGEFFLDGHAKRQNQDSQGFETRERELYLREGVELKTSGYAYHPNFCDWHANFRLGAMQERLTIDQQDFATDGVLLGYNLSGLFLKEKTFAFRPFASFDQSQQDRDFAQSVETQEARHGMEVMYKTPIFASLLGEQVDHSDSGGLRETDRKSNHLRFELSDNRDRDWLTKFSYDFMDTDETSEFMGAGGGSTQVDLPDTSHELTLNNIWKFGPKTRQNNLSGRIRFLDRKGFLNNQVFSFDQSLDLAHTKTFSTFYRVLYDQDTFDDDEDRLAQGEVGFRKRFYKSLDVTGRLLAARQEFTGGSQDSLGGSLDLDYRKKTDIGLYTCNLGFGLERTKLQNGGGNRFIRGETISLPGITFVRLAEPNVIGALTVSNLARTIVYVEGVDFLTQRIGAFTEIARIPTGDILDGQAVLVDYAVTTTGQAEYETGLFNWRQKLRLKDIPVSFYTDLRLQRETLRSGMDPGNLENQTDILVGSEVDWKGLTVSVEHEEMDLELSPPWTADRLRANYRTQLHRDLDLSVGAHAGRTNYQNVEEFKLGPNQDRLTMLGYNAALTAKLHRNLLVRLRSDLTDSSGRQNSMLWRNGFVLEWRYGKLDFTLEYRHDMFEQEQTTGDADSVYVTVRRRF